MDSSAIDNNFLTTISQHLETFKSDFQEEFKKLQDAVGKVEGSASKIVSEIDQKLDIESIMSPVNDFWSKASDQSSVAISNFSCTVQRIERHVFKYSPFINIVFYALGGIFILLILVGFILTVLLCSCKPNYSEYLLLSSL